MANFPLDQYVNVMGNRPNWATLLNQLLQGIRVQKELQQKKQYEDLLRAIQFGGDIPQPQEKKLLGLITTRTDPYSQIPKEQVTGAGNYLQLLNQMTGKPTIAGEPAQPPIGELGYNIRQKQVEQQRKDLEEQRKLESEALDNFYDYGSVTATLNKFLSPAAIESFKTKYPYGYKGQAIDIKGKEAETKGKAVEGRGKITEYQEKTLEMKERERIADPMRRARASLTLKQLYPKANLTDEHISTFLKNNPDF